MNDRKGSIWIVVNYVQNREPLGLCRDADLQETSGREGSI